MVQIKIDHDSAAEAPYKTAKKLFIKSYGCQMNVYDADRMAELLAPHGYGLTPDPEGADMIILNTCHIREKADEKVFSDLGRMREQVADGALIAVGGCVGQAEGSAIIERAKYVDLVFGPQTYHRLPELIAQAERTRGVGVVDVDLPELEKFDRLPKPTATGAAAFVTIQEGCDKFCSFCVVPYTRGAEISRPFSHIVDEVKHLADQGVREITLLGQNVNAYHGTDGQGRPADLAALMAEIGLINGIERIRFTTSHPHEMTDSLIASFAHPKVMPYLHLPVQAGSDRVLAAMNRRHTAAEYIGIIERVRAVRPDIALSGDFIVGFPGESESDYQDTLALVHAVKYAQAYSFGYSKRPGTPGAAMDGQVPEDVKKERLAGLQALLEAQQNDYNAQFLGQTLEVLVERDGKHPGQIRGRSPHNVAVNMEGNERLIGNLIRVNIVEARPRSLVGKIELVNA